jgi:serine/threonine protein kinase
VNADRLEIKEIFCEALEKATLQERIAYLDEACEGRPEVRSRVNELLRLHEDVGDFLESPVLDPDITPEDSQLTEQPGTVIGRYKLLQRIGEGGMAVVYMAEQERPVRRKVALKIIKLGMDTRQVIARFEAERQALAMMDHPNIAKVLDAGATDTGRPYFVMELVTGVSITKYCDQDSLSTKDRLALFIQVCNAVQHAHQKGIIHRDIKPSNVMVTQRDGTPVPKVIDFGIAKATNQRLTEKTLFTRYAHIIGTPAYMSPEQAELSDVDIDTRSDIYSLGVLLYELLTGTTPFGEEELRQAGYVEMQRIIREEEPTKPSTKLSMLGATLTEVAQQRRVSSDALRKLIRGDLDWIAMKALEKSRSRRYDTASAVAADIQRHLGHEPVLAHPPGMAYRVRKYLRKHRVRTVAALFLAVLIGSLAITLSMWNKNRSQLAAAQDIKDRTTLSDAREARGQGDPNAALATVESVLDSRHVGPEARLLHAQLLLDLQGPTAAVREFEALLDEQRISDEIAGQAHFLLAKIYYDSDPAAPGRTEEYRHKWEYHRQEAARLLPESADAYLLQAMGAGTVRKTLEVLDRALKLDGRHYQSLRQRAHLHYINKDYLMMARDAAKMTVIRPDQALGYSLSAIAQRELKHYDEAIVDHDEAVRLSPEEPELYDQRCQTYMQMGRYEDALGDAQRCAHLDPNEDHFHFRVFCILTALGRYEAARTKYEMIVASEMTKPKKYRLPSYVEYNLYRLATRHVFDMLTRGQAWHPEDNPPVGSQFWSMFEAAHDYLPWAAKGQPAGVKGLTCDWSPDGNELAYSCGVAGSTGVAIWNRQAGETRLLTIPGRDPVWSPDGQTIAYARDRQILPLQSITAAHAGPRAARDLWLKYENLQEIWLIKADGTEDPTFLVKGGRPRWSKHSNRIFFRPSLTASDLCSISPDGTDVRALTLHPSEWGPVISPDDRYMACQQINYVQVRDMRSGELVADWLAPLGVLTSVLSWSPDGEKLSICIRSAESVSQGLWILDLSRKTVSKVLSGPCSHASWSGADVERIAVVRNYGSMHSEIWTGTTAALGPGRTVDEHVQAAIDLCDECIDADPTAAWSYASRAALYIYLNDARRAFADLDQYESLVGDPNEKAATYDQLGWHVCNAPQKTVDPGIAVELHRRAHVLNPRHRWYRAALGMAYYRAGRWQDAINTIESVDLLENHRDYLAFFAAVAYWQMGDKGKAQIWFKRGVCALSRKALERGTSYLTARYGYYMQSAELMGLKVKHFNREAQATGPQILPVTVQVKSSQFGGIAAHLADGTGLSDGDEDGLLEHSEDPNHMWLSQQGRTEGPLEFDLGQEYELGSMLVWNYNKRGHTQRGVKQADISVWTAESGWHPIQDEITFAEAEGSFDYDEPTHIQLDGISAQKLRLDNLRSFGVEEYVGLSEVQFFERRDGDLQ